MSMHKKPLTPLEECGLRAYRLPIGTPSQLSDVFRCGIAWALANPSDDVLSPIRPGYSQRPMPGGDTL